MSVYKRGRIYYYHFYFDGQHIQESTKQRSRDVAEGMERAHHVRLAKEKDEKAIKAEQLGCAASSLARCPECDRWFNTERSIITRDSKRVCSDVCRESWNKKCSPVPTLSQFCCDRIEPWTKAQFEKAAPKTWLWYRTGLRSLYDYEPIANAKLNEITTEKIADFTAYRQTHSRRSTKKKQRGLQVASVNSSLQVLRRVLRLAVDWGIIPSAPKVKLLRGANHRERVISSDEEIRYLSAAGEPLSSIATVLLDSGLRPEECLRLRWENISFDAGHYGTLFNPFGKTKAARRLVPMTPRLRTLLETRWIGTGKPTEGWVWPAETASGHAEPSTIKKQHEKALKLSGVRPFVLYSLRHTFLTRLGESGCDVFTLARIAGHSNIQMALRYVHVSEDAAMVAMSRLPEPKLLTQ
jgi:integrase